MISNDSYYIGRSIPGTAVMEYTSGHLYYSVQPSIADTTVPYRNPYPRVHRVPVGERPYGMCVCMSHDPTSTGKAGMGYVNQSDSTIGIQPSAVPTLNNAQKKTSLNVSIGSLDLTKINIDVSSFTRWVRENQPDWDSMLQEVDSKSFKPERVYTRLRNTSFYIWRLKHCYDILSFYKDFIHRQHSNNGAALSGNVEGWLRDLRKSLQDAHKQYESLKEFYIYEMRHEKPITTIQKEITDLKIKLGTDILQKIINDIKLSPARVIEVGQYSDCYRRLEHYSRTLSCLQDYMDESPSDYTNSSTPEECDELLKLVDDVLEYIGKKYTFAIQKCNRSGGQIQIITAAP